MFSLKSLGAKGGVLTLVLLTILFFVHANRASAQPSPNTVLNLYVSTTGNDSNTCSSMSPCLTIGGAVSKWASTSWNSGIIQINLAAGT